MNLLRSTAKYVKFPSSELAAILSIVQSFTQTRTNRALFHSNFQQPSTEPSSLLSDWTLALRIFTQPRQIPLLLPLNLRCGLLKVGIQNLPLSPEVAPRNFTDTSNHLIIVDEELKSKHPYQNKKTNKHTHSLSLSLTHTSAFQQT